MQETDGKTQLEKPRRFFPGLALNRLIDQAGALLTEYEQKKKKNAPSDDFLSDIGIDIEKNKMLKMKAKSKKTEANKEMMIFEMRQRARAIAKVGMAWVKKNPDHGLARGLMAAGMVNQHSVLSVLLALYRLMNGKSGWKVDTCFEIAGLGQPRRIAALRVALASAGHGLGQLLDRNFDAQERLRAITFFDRKRRDKKTSHRITSVRRPDQIYKSLEKMVVGQESAKITLSVAAYNHQQRTKFPKAGYPKSVVMMVGPSGSGKTLIAESMARVGLGLPFLSFAASSLTSSGYHGNGFEDVLNRLYVQAGRDKEYAESGVVLLDEIDKIRSNGRLLGSTGSGADVGGEAVQDEALQIIAGTNLVLSSNTRNPFGHSPDSMQTGGILWVMCGAFQGLDTIRQARIKKASGGTAIGFGDKNRGKVSESTEYVIEDFIEFGLKKELLGRVTAICELSPLDRDSFCRILDNKNSGLLIPWQKIYRKSGLKLRHDTKFLNLIVDTAIARGTGARGLHATLESVFNGPMFEAAKDRYKGPVLATVKAGMPMVLRQ